MRSILLIVALIPISSSIQAQNRRAIEFPDIPGFHTMICDLHIHTAFSDGSVWPNIRVQEAYRDEIDAIAITDHLEYLPHRADIPLPNHNRAFEVAKRANNDPSLIIIPGAEITRGMPPGHVNAIFIKDANALISSRGEEPMDIMNLFEEVHSQSGYAFWNHPAWIAQRPDGVAVLDDLHRVLIDSDLLQGIEVANQFTYSDEALQIALDYNLAILATSDIHGLIDWDFEVAEGGHRPVTLVFTEERTAKSLHEGLRARRTVAWFRNTLIGRESELLPLIHASITISKAVFRPRTSVLDITLENNSDARFLLRNTSDYTFHEDANLVEFRPHSSTVFTLKTAGQDGPYPITFEVLNAITAPNTHPEITLIVEPDV
ncbi:MAG: Sb-PDE family phosphodiesterase [Bacteroidetes bacterium]|nr:Sb-PDE family phosphodiesterase [Bacteroidota bacterium]